MTEARSLSPAAAELPVYHQPAATMIVACCGPAPSPCPLPPGERVPGDPPPSPHCFLRTAFCLPPTAYCPSTMRIATVDTIPLRGATHDHGWPGGTDPSVQYNTLVEVRTDEGLSGIGSCYTTRALVEGALEVLRPMLWARPPLSRSASAKSCASPPSGSDAEARSNTRSAAWTSLCGTCWARRSVSPSRGCWAETTATGSSPMRRCCLRSRRCCATSCRSRSPAAFRAIKMGWRPFGRVSRQYDELLVRTARETVGPDVELMVDAGGSEQFWPHGVHWARETAQDAGRLWRRVVRRGAAAG